MTRHYLALDGALATKIIPYRPTFIPADLFLMGVIRTAHWVGNNHLSELEAWHYLNEWLPMWFLSTSVRNEAIVTPTEFWDDKLDELLEATAKAISATYPLLNPILTSIPNTQTFSYINRDGAGIYLEMHHD